MIRDYRRGDAEATLRLFERAIAETARAEYTQEQVAAWLGVGQDVGEWHADRSCVRTFVADEDGTAVGFTDVDDGGYVDRLFVSPDHGRRGIGAALLDHVIEVARREELPVLSTHASLVARPVFERAGFEVVERETVHRGAVALDRFLMRRQVDL